MKILDFGLSEMLFYSPESFYKSGRCVWTCRKPRTKNGWIIFAGSTGDEQDILCWLHIQSEWNIILGNSKKSQNFQNWNCSKKKSTCPIPIFFYFLKTSRAGTFISEVLVDIWQECGTLRHPFVTMDLAKIQIWPPHSLPYVPMHQNTCEHVQLIDSNTKFDLSSWIINRFQWFLVFWKAEDLLFHLKATVCTNCKFFAEKNNFSYKNVQLIWKFVSLVIWDLLGGRAKWPPKPYNCVRYVPSPDEDR